MIGTKIYKNDMKNYTECANWCNGNNATIEDKGEYYECVAIPALSLDELKQDKINELKSTRDTLETEPIEYNGNLYDYDEKARERINAAIIALDVQGADASIDWTTADNQDVKVTVYDLRAIVAAVAVRSNALHVKYRKAKEQVEAATTAADVEAVTFEV